MKMAQENPRTRSGPKIPAAELFGGRLYFGFGLLDAIFANQNSLAEGIQTADHLRNFKFSFQTYLVRATLVLEASKWLI